MIFFTVLSTVFVGVFNTLFTALISPVDLIFLGLAFLSRFVCRVLPDFNGYNLNSLKRNPHVIEFLRFSINNLIVRTCVLLPLTILIITLFFIVTLPFGVLNYFVSVILTYCFVISLITYHYLFSYLETEFPTEDETQQDVTDAEHIRSGFYSRVYNSIYYPTYLIGINQYPYSD